MRHSADWRCEHAVVDTRVDGPDLLLDFYPRLDHRRGRREKNQSVCRGGALRSTQSSHGLADTDLVRNEIHVDIALGVVLDVLCHGDFGQLLGAVKGVSALCLGLETSGRSKTLEQRSPRPRCLAPLRLIHMGADRHLAGLLDRLLGPRRRTKRQTETTRIRLRCLNIDIAPDIFHGNFSRCD